MNDRNPVSSSRCKYTYCHVDLTAAIAIELPLNADSVQKSEYFGCDFDILSIPEFVYYKEFTMFDGDRKALAICDLPITDKRLRQIREHFYKAFPNPVKYETTLSKYMRDTGNLAHPIIRTMVAAFDDYEYERLTNQPTPYPSLRFIDREGENIYKWRVGLPLDVRQAVVKKAMKFFGFPDDDTETPILSYDAPYYESICADPASKGEPAIPEIYRQICEQHEQRMRLEELYRAAGEIK